MKLITLNIWGGKLFEPLMEFIQSQSDVDVFCFQEVFNSDINKTFGKGFRSNIFTEIGDKLPNYKGYFASTSKINYMDGNVDFSLEVGLSFFVRKPIEVIEAGNIFIYRNQDEKFEDIKDAPRNLQYLKLNVKGERWLFSHFHGIWYPKTKVDTVHRLAQSEKIRKFLDNSEGKKILCGDFNLMPDTESFSILAKGMQNLVKQYNVITTRNHLYERDEKFADYILASSGINIKDFKVFQNVVSDHLPLLVDFD